MAQPRYQVIERIDAGGMAEVFKAESNSMQGFQKLVAIKRVLPSLTKNQRFIRMFLDEAKVSLHLNHTNCVQVFDLGIADGTYFIVMEYIDGTNLKNILEHVVNEKMQLPVEQVVYIAIEICKGLAHAHGKRDLEDRPLHIVHRDISPPNVLMSREGEVKITDFGLAKAQSQVEQTDPGVVKGKFGYLSPEAANGEGVDLRTDIFAVGILIWEMLMGRRLFLGKTDYETLKQVQVARIPNVQDVRPDVPHQLVEILERALHKDIDRRHQDARSLASDLANFLFEYSRPVTGFDISLLVEGVMSARGKGRKDGLDDSKINEVVQREINALVSLEEVEDLDLMLADMYDSTSTHDAGARGDLGDWENPADWGLDVGMEADDAPSFLARSPGGGADTWQEAGLGDLMRPENARAAAEKAKREQAEAISTPDIERTASQRQAAHRARQEQAAREALSASQQRATPPQQAQQRDDARRQPEPAQQQQQQHPQAPQQQQHANRPAEMMAPQHQNIPPVASGQPDEEGSNVMLVVALVILLVLLLAVAGGILFALK